MRRLLSFCVCLLCVTLVGLGFATGQTSAALGGNFPSFGIVPEQLGGNAIYENITFCEGAQAAYVVGVCYYDTTPVAIQFIESFSR